METQPMVDELKKAEIALRRKIEETKALLAEVEEDLRHIIGVIAFYERNPPMLEVARPNEAFERGFSVGVYTTATLHGMSHRQAVIAIAKHGGGIVRAQEAKKLMIEAGVMRNTKNATHMVHNAIISSERF